VGFAVKLALGFWFEGPQPDTKRASEIMSVTSRANLLLLIISPPWVSAIIEKMEKLTKLGKLAARFGRSFYCFIFSVRQTCGLEVK